MLKVFLPNGKSKEYPQDASILEISREFQSEYSSPIVACTINGEEKDLQNNIEDGIKIDFIEHASNIGVRVYMSSLILVLYTSILECFEGFPRLLVKSHFAGGIYCEVVSDEQLPENYIEILKGKMQEIIAEKTPIVYQKISRVLTEKVLRSNGDYDRLGLIEQLAPERGIINSYTCKGVYGYFFSPMVPHAGYLKEFDLISYHGRILLRCPDRKNVNKVEAFVDQPKLSGILREAEKWGEIINCSTINQLNHIIEKGEIKSIIRVAEALHEKKIAEIADKIHAEGDKIRLITIAGPSSSGKTTFAQRLKVQLQVNGIKPVPISIDDYFLERSDAPRKENGDYDFESVYAIDLPLFNDHLKRLLAGETVAVPHYNFITGLREYRGKKIRLAKKQPLMIEGIHGLNNRLTSIIPNEQKLKIYISPLAQLRMDNFNLIEKSEIRLLRRMVRDSRFRAYNAAQTIKQWQYVLEGEEENIAPYIKNADIIFNTALIYEMAVLKKEAEALLKEIDNSQPEYTIAKRLLSLLEYVESVDSKEIPPNSLIREFIGDSWFN